MITRRTLAASALALAGTPVVARAVTPAKTRPIVIAHRGASGERPEHTLMAYELAITQGADFIEPDLVPTKDGHLVARHENEIGGTTDVAARPEFAGRKTTKTIDGEPVTGWFTEDFTLAELKTLRARERLPQLRPANTKFDGREAIPTFEEVVKLAKAKGVGVYPEMKHPSYFAGIGLPLEARLADALKAADLNSADAKVFVQCFEAEPLKTFGRLSKARRVFLVSDGPGPSLSMLSADGLQQVKGFAEGVGLEWSLVVMPQGMPTYIPHKAHELGLFVHAWTVRAENHFLPPILRNAGGPAAHGNVEVLLNELFCWGADGVFSDFPAIAVKLRDRGCVHLPEDPS
ncbi:glycerophosphodiester phosphodiesterase [Phenylobacterium sp. J426]|uniref:glycerophosphodiester phosphodiesterase family protein n=1 Tax=Phenylobacterium sp. J426 TaxID=2898439 RepID=UPI002151DE84|nr:glycerophosphodiester phosphodiesterase family protein [Phenylobacterium sp. J426]MCR5874277.1 glycerophosphodiester phosphodiesterase [Phenylobacterium sp. J426]